VRRNWGALVVILSLASFTMIDAIGHLFFTGRTINLYFFEGNVGVTSFESKSRVAPRKRFFFDAQFHAPIFSTSGGYYPSKGGFIASVPLCAPAALFAVWIAFREWRRKRAAKGKACPG
jgi:hypothetical protein